jgi:hypothetical protein
LTTKNTDYTEPELVIKSDALVGNGETKALRHFADALTSFSMSRTVQLTVPMPSKLAKLRFPKALDARLQFLLDEQGRKGRLTSGEKKEAEGLVQMATTLSILKLGAQVKTLKD